jgi:hypothetical protein
MSRGTNLERFRVPVASLTFVCSRSGWGIKFPKILSRHPSLIRGPAIAELGSLRWHLSLQRLVPGALTEIDDDKLSSVAVAANRDTTLTKFEVPAAGSELPD